MKIISLSEKIEKAFKSLIKSGRPDVYDDNNNNLIESLYVDLFKNDYILRQVLDDNHTLLKGRRGTGKSTIFLRAERELEKTKNSLAVYINLQSCYEEVKSANSEEENQNITRYLTYKNFLNQILKRVQSRFTGIFKSEKAFTALFKEIEEGMYIDKDFKRSIEITDVKNKENNTEITGSIDNKMAAKLGVVRGQKSADEFSSSTTLNELRIFSIHEILNKIEAIARKKNILKIYLFLDDFSELNIESQKVVVDSLIAPIISSYNSTFKIKLAAYPSRIYTGSIDATKLPSYELDFYDAFEQSSTNYSEVENLAIDYLQRTLEKRLEVYTEGQIGLEEIFDLSKAKLEEYLKLLFNCSASIPRSLGFILNYAYLSSINKGLPITIDNINSASIKYYEENILADFINDARFKQSFYDDKDLLNQLAQKNLMDKIVEKMFNLKREIIEDNNKGLLKKQIFIDTLKENRKGLSYWLPTSHFYVNTDIEKFLKTLELYFIVNKFNEGSSRTPGKKISFYGLNYGLCLSKKIDYGRPSFRRTYDYWRQDEFNLNKFIPKVISSIEVIECENCGMIYNETEYSIYEKRKRCFECGNTNTVKKKNKFSDKLNNKINIWSAQKLPDHYIDILRVLYNNSSGEPMAAYDIGLEIDRHHLSVTHAMNKLSEYKYVEIVKKERRYYKISDLAITNFFSDSLESFVN